MNLLEIDDVVRTFSGVVALDHVSLTVPRGVIFGFIGPNGAGKTTLVNLVTGYLSPTSGAIRLDGESVVGYRPHELARAGVARTYQNLRLFDGASVLENVLIGRHLAFARGAAGVLMPWRQRRTQVRQAMALLDRVSLAHVAGEDVSDLPYGLRRRVEIARALAVEPRILLLDEPSAGMTRSEADDIGALMVDIARAGTTVVLVEHNVRLVSAVCDHVAVLDFGEVIAEGTPAEVWADPRVRTAYLGESGHDDGRHA